MLLKQPGQRNVVTPFLRNEFKFNVTPTQERRPARNAWLFVGRFNRFTACDEIEANMLRASIRNCFT